MSEREFDEYLRELSSRLGRRVRRDEIDGELRDHFEESFVELLAAGVSRDEAIQRTLDDFGDTAALATGLSLAGRGRQRRQLLRWSGGASVAFATGLVLLLAMWPEGARVPLAPAASAQANSDAAAAKEQANADVEKLLAKRVSFEFVETPLADVVAFLRDSADVPLHLDRIQLESAGIGADRPVTLAAKDVPLEIALNRLCGELTDMTWTYRDEAIELTSPEAAEQQIESHTYDVRDLLAPRDRGASGINHSPSAVELVEALKLSIKPDTWAESGGMGRAAISDGALIVTQAWRVQFELERLLRQIRLASELARPAAAGQERPRTTPVSLPIPNDASRKILARLAERRVALDFVATPLSDICQFLSDAYAIPVVLDRYGLESAGIGTDRPLTLQQRVSSLQSTLNRVTRETNELTWTISDDAILVTTKDRLAQRLSPRVYPVSDLIVGDDQDDRNDSIEAIVELITSHVGIQDSTWTNDGGAANALPLTQHAAIVVYQTAPAHLQIEQFLADLRAARKRGAADSAPPIDPNARVLTVYWIPPANTHPSLEELTKLITDLIEPGSWRGALDTYIQPIGQRLVVRQSPAVQRKIKRFLIKDMNLPVSIPAQGGPAPPPVVGGIGGGMGGGFF